LRRQLGAKRGERDGVATPQLGQDADEESQRDRGELQLFVGPLPPHLQAQFGVAAQVGRELSPRFLGERRVVLRRRYHLVAVE